MSVWQANGGVYLGCKANSLQGLWNGDRNDQHRYDDDRHLLLLGPNGSGKTRRLLYPNLLYLQDWSVLVVDPKGVLADLTHDKRKGEKIVIDPFKVTALSSTNFNPLSVLNPDDDTFIDDCLALARSLIQIEGSEPHWSSSAQDLICAMIMYVVLKPLAPVLELPDDRQGELEVGEEEEVPDPLPDVTTDLSCVRRLLGLRESKFRRLIVDMQIVAVTTPYEELAIKAARFASINPENKELNSIVSTALTQTRWLDSRPIKASLASGSFDFAAMKERVVTVYLVLPPNRLVTHGAWLRLMITSILQPLLKDVTPASVPVLFMLDEFAQLGHLPMIEENLAVMREYGVKLWPVFQDVAQGQAIYGKRWPSFLSNSGVIQSFGAMDVDTADMLSKRSGQTTEWIEVPSESRTVLPEPSRSFSSAAQIIQRPVLWPHDLMDMDEGYTVLYSHRAKGPTFAFAPWPRSL